MTNKVVRVSKDLERDPSVQDVCVFSPLFLLCMYGKMSVQPHSNTPSYLLYVSMVDR